MKNMAQPHRRQASRFLVAAALFLIACGTPKDKEADERQPTVRIGIIPISEVAPLYVGVEMGFFAQEGISLDLVRMAGGAEILPAVATGDLDIGFSNVVSLLFFSQNRPDARYRVITGGTYETSADLNHALVAKDSTLRDGAKLRGKTFAINTRNNIEELMLRRFLSSRGISDSAIRLRPVPFPAMLPALKNGDVDVASVVEPFIARSIRDGTHVVARQYLISGGEDTVLVAAYVTTARWLEQNADAATRFRRGFSRATAFIADTGNESRVREIVAKYTSVDEGDARQMGLPLMLDCFSRRGAQAVDSLMRRYFQDYRGFPSDSIITADTPLCGAP